jgi:hypothetical protein
MSTIDYIKVGTATQNIQLTSTINNSGRLDTLNDVDITEKIDGSIIIWDAAAAKYKVKPKLEHSNLFIIGGTF